MSEDTIDQIISVCVIPLWTTWTNTPESDTPEIDRHMTSSRGMTQT